MTKYNVGDYIKVNDGELFGKRIEEVVIIEVDHSDDTFPYKITTRAGKQYWIGSSGIVEDEQNELEERYTTGSGKQLYDVFEHDLLEPDELRGFYKGNIYKYVKRYPKKNGLEDLEKARDYIDLLIKLEKTLGELE